MVQVLCPEDLDPPWEGDLALEDAETHEVLDVTLDDLARDAYLRRLHGLFGSLRAAAKKLRASYVLANTTRPLLEPVRRLVDRAVD
jgi:hypothetical protein